MAKTETKAKKKVPKLTKFSHGGARENSGPEKGTKYDVAPKTYKSLRLRNDIIALGKERADREDITFTDLVEAALLYYMENVKPTLVDGEGTKP